MTLRRIKELARGDAIPNEKLRDTSNIARYYDFLVRLARDIQPEIIVELGTSTGNSASRFAFGNPQAKVITIDIAPDGRAQEMLKNFDNIDLWIGDDNSKETIKKVSGLGAIDILFIDTIHNFNQAWAEYCNYSPFVKKGGIILYDDILLDDDMERFWDKIPAPKIELHQLHWTGFGASIKE